MKKLFFYGSLKRGFYNHRRFEVDRRARYAGEAVLPGALLYDLGAYPCAVLTGRDSDLVHGEVYETDDEDFVHTVHLVETGAGYVARELLIDGAPVIVYVFEASPGGRPVVKGGRWEEKG